MRGATVSSHGRHTDANEDRQEGCSWWEMEAEHLARFGRRVLAVAVLGEAMVLLEATVVNVALPAERRARAAAANPDDFARLVIEAALTRNIRVIPSFFKPRGKISFR